MRTSPKLTDTTIIYVMRIKIAIAFYQAIEKRRPDLCFDYTGAPQKMGDAVRMLPPPRYKATILQLDHARHFIVDMLAADNAVRYDETSFFAALAKEARYIRIPKRAKFFAGAVTDIWVKDDTLCFLFSWGTK